MDQLIKESLEFAQEFDVDKYGLITNPGKFERECQYVPYFYNLIMHSAQDDVIDDFNGTNVEFVFNITESNIKLFPVLKGIKKAILFESDSGFVYCNLKD